MPKQAQNAAIFCHLSRPTTQGAVVLLVFQLTAYRLEVLFAVSGLQKMTKNGCILSLFWHLFFL